MGKELQTSPAAAEEVWASVTAQTSINALLSSAGGCLSFVFMMALCRRCSFFFMTR